MLGEIYVDCKRIPGKLLPSPAAGTFAAVVVTVAVVAGAGAAVVGGLSGGRRLTNVGVRLRITENGQEQLTIRFIFVVEHIARELWVVLRVVQNPMTIGIRLNSEGFLRHGEVVLGKKVVQQEKELIETVEEIAALQGRQIG